MTRSNQSHPGFVDLLEPIERLKNPEVWARLAAEQRFLDGAIFHHLDVQHPSFDSTARSK